MTNSTTSTSSANSNSNSRSDYLKVILNNIKNRQDIIDSLFKEKTWLQCYINIGVILCFYFILIIFFLLRRLSVLDVSSIGSIFLFLTFVFFIIIGYTIKSAYDKINEYLTKDPICNSNENNVTTSSVNTTNTGNNNCDNHHGHPHYHNTLWERILQFFGLADCNKCDNTFSDVILDNYNNTNNRTGIYDIISNNDYRSNEDKPSSNTNSNNYIFDNSCPYYNNDKLCLYPERSYNENL